MHVVEGTAKFSPSCSRTAIGQFQAMVGEVPTIRSSDTDTDYPIVSDDLVTNFRSNTIASSLQTGGF